jgi:uncharacterized protein (DUF427 family)
MTERRVLEPNPDHPIAIEPTAARLRVYSADRVVADTTNALTMREAAYPPVYYIPRADVVMSLLTPSEPGDYTTYCPYKGDASYQGLRQPDGTILDNKVWFYDAPYPAVVQIADHVAFYDDAVDIALT